MSTEFWTNLDRLADAVQRNPLTELQSYKPRPAATSDLIRESEKQFGTPLPQGLVDLYSVHNGVEFEWRFYGGYQEEPVRFDQEQATQLVPEILTAPLAGVAGSGSS